MKFSQLYNISKASSGHLLSLVQKSRQTSLHITAKSTKIFMFSGNDYRPFRWSL